MNNFDLDPFMNGKVVKAGRTRTNVNKFKPRQGAGGRPAPFDPTRFNPFDQTTSGDALTAPRDPEVRVRPSGNLPAFLLPEDHRLLVMHPQYRSISHPDGTVDHYQMSEGRITCTCGRQHMKYEGTPDETAPHNVIDWPEDMVKALEILDDRPVQQVSEDETEWTW